MPADDMVSPCAEQLELTTAGLQRRLREAGLSFSQLVENTRRELALHYLRQPQRPISELAPLLGYSETSAFSRAFRRWFGVSPRQWRSDASGVFPLCGPLHEALRERLPSP